MRKEISLVIPAYNEARRIGGVLDSYLPYLKKNFRNFELIVVCNNCSDNTPEIVSGYAKGCKGILPVNIPGKTGKGGAVIEGFKRAKNNLVAFVDADLSTVPKEFDKVVAAVGKEFDAAVGSRTLEDSVIARQPSQLRRLLGKGFPIYANTLFSLGIKDTQCGAKAFKKSAIKSVLPHLFLRGWEFDVELLWKLKRRGYRIKEVPITWTNDEHSKVTAGAVFEMFIGLLKLRLFHAGMAGRSAGKNTKLQHKQTL